MSKQFPKISLTSGFIIETWYDRPSRSWVSQLKDRDGNQIDEAEYDGDRDSVPVSRKMLRTRATCHNK